MIRRLVVGAAAAALIAYAAGLVATSGLLPPAGVEGADPRAVVIFVAATFVVSILQVIACVVSHRNPPRLWLVLLVAFGARLVLIFGAPKPFLEGDLERMRFDARMARIGLNPYEFRPCHLLDGTPPERTFSDPELERLARVRAAMSASETAPRPDNVLYPGHRSCYTPLGLWLTSVGDRFKPDSTRGTAFLVLVADTLAVYLLLLALRAMRMPLSWVMLYAWSPVLLKEAYVTMAIDAFVLPAVAGMVLCIATGRRMLTAVPLAVAAGLRPAMLLLLPVKARRIGLLGLLLALALLAFPVLPFLRIDIPVGSYLEGQLHVWRYFEYNSLAENLARAALRGYHGIADNSLSLLGVELVQPGDPLGPLLAKLVLLGILLGVTTYATIRLLPPEAPAGVVRDAAFSDLFTMLAALLLLSPVIHPWHALWLLPVLVVRPSLCWLSLPAILSLSYLTHIEGARAADLTFLNGQVSFRALEYGLFGLLWVLDRLWRPELFPRAVPSGLTAGIEATDEFDAPSMALSFETADTR